MKKLMVFLCVSIMLGSQTVYANHQDNLLDPNRFLIIAHRGASAYAPEHTLEAYRLAHQRKADYLEIDLNMTADGVLVAIHDDRVDRTTNGHGLVKNYPLKELRQLDAGSWFNQANPAFAKPKYEGLRIPTLEQIFQEFGKKANYYIETKNPHTYPGMEEKLVSLLNRNFSASELKKGKVIVESFSEESLQKVHQLNSNLPLIRLQGFSGTAQLSSTEIRKLSSYAVGIGVNYQSVTKGFVTTMKKAGLLLHAYTVDQPADKQRMKDLGVTGIFTDRIK